ncbi:MAG: hypothetical protein GYA36_00185 [Veillonellaceae bacterium]|nr:hypothetical protein [Veillonellaceae bacterium]
MGTLRGHGPHILCGFAVYKHHLIFYSFGDFIIQNDSVRSRIRSKTIAQRRPELASQEDGERILNELAVLSEEFGTKIEIRNGRGYIRL